MKKIICLLLLIMPTLTGCSSLFRVDEDLVKDVTDKVTHALINTVGQEKAERQESHTIDSKDKKTLSLNNSVGDISIVTHQSDDTIINLNITSKAGAKEKAEEILDNYTYRVDTEGDQIIVDTSIHELETGISMTVDLLVYIPENINNIRVESNVGSVQIKGASANLEIDNNVGDIIADNIKGSYNLKVDVGEILLRDCSAAGSSDFKANTGDINITFSDISEAASITAETGVGDIEMSLNEDAGYHAVINEFMKDERIERKNNEYTAILLTSGVGEINLK